MKEERIVRSRAHPRRRRGQVVVSAVAALTGLAAVGALGITYQVSVSRASDALPHSAAPERAPKCDEGNGGITLPAGFCATVFADKLGAARHPVVTPNGDVYIALAARRAGATTGGVVVLRDSDSDGKADKQETFGVNSGGGGLALSGEYLYLDARTAIVRYRLTKGVMLPAGAPDTLITDLPTGGHTTREIALDGKGNLFVNVGSATNVCQPPGRDISQKGIDPCVELETRAGIWKFSDSRTGQKFSPEARYVTGLRNGVGLKWNARDNALYATQHGRDNLFQGFPQLYNQKKSAENPAEELMKLEAGDDFGWPYCYYDIDLKRRVLAPEYSGDAKMPGRCANKKNPVVAFPGHWAPNAVEFYSGTRFPARYRDGAFVAFHGSWNRSPEPQGGFKVVYAPARQFNFAGTYEVFADGFGGNADPAQGPYRPTGLTTMPDGSLLITDDKAGRVWKVMYTR